MWVKSVGKGGGGRGGRIKKKLVGKGFSFSPPGIKNIKTARPSQALPAATAFPLLPLTIPLQELVP